MLNLSKFVQINSLTDGVGCQHMSTPATCNDFKSYGFA